MRITKFSPKQEQIFNFMADDNRYLYVTALLEVVKQYQWL